MGTTVKDNIPDLAAIAEQFRILESRVVELTRRVSTLEGSGYQVATSVPEQNTAEAIPILDAGESLGEWISRGKLLHKMAILCFILVFALLLRTVTDYGYINVTAGSFLGLTYVSILALVGCVFYITGKEMANVFSISGFLLLFTIVFEGYGRFGTIPAGVAYAILFVALITSAVVGIKYKVIKLLVVSLVGVTVSSLMINFPQIYFPFSGILFFLANWVAIIAAERLFTDKLKWPISILTLLFWAIWAFKLNLPISRGEVVPDYLHHNWFIPLLVSFVVLYFMTYLRRYCSEVRLTFYDAVIPSLNIMLLFLAATIVVDKYWHQPLLLGLVFLAVSFGHFAVGWRLSTNTRDRQVAVGGAFVAGTIGLALGVPVIVGNVAWAVAVWSLLAYGLARFSGSCRSTVMRLISYLFQVFTLMTGLALGVFVAGTYSCASLTAAASLAVFGYMQFKWCRQNPLPKESLLAKLDSKDYSALVILLISLIGIYLFSDRVVALISSMMLSEPENSIKCGRSIIINAGAAILLLLGGRKHDKELVWIAVFLGIIGFLKVFLADLFGASGIPLVLSVLSSGVVAMVGSIIMGRWSRSVDN